MIEQVFLTNQKLKINLPQILKTKCIVNSRKFRSRKQFTFGEVKTTKSKKKKIFFVVYIFLIAFIQNQKSFEKSHLCLHYTFLIFF